MSSSDEAAAEAPPNDDENSESESSEDELLFKFPQRGAFKRRVEKSDSDDDSDDDSDGEGKGKRGGSSNDSDSDGDDMGGAFNSSPETSRQVRSSLGSMPGGGGGAAGRGTGRSAQLNMDDPLLDSDDDMPPMPAPKRRRKALTEEERTAQANAKVDELLESDGGGSAPRNANKKDREFARRMQKKLADATKIDSGGGSGSRTRGGSAIHGAAAACATDTSAEIEAITAARRERELDRKRVKLTVQRSKRQRHVFSTSWGKSVHDVEESCRGELSLVSRDEEEDSEIALFYKDKKLDSNQTLRQAGVPAEGNVTLRLDVTGDGGGGGGGGGASGPPITVKVRVEGGKTFAVSTTTETKFSAFMEGFAAKVGIPPERAHEGVFRFDGDKLSPDDTPEDLEMESDDLIEAKFPENLMNGVQASATEVSLVAPKAKKVARKVGAGKAAARNRTAAAVAAAAKPLGGGASRSPHSGMKRCTRGGGAREAPANAVKQPEIVVLD